MDNLEVRVKEVVVEILGVPLENIETQHSFQGDLGMDSLGAVELIMALEDAFSVEIPETVARKLLTVQDAIDFLSSAQAELAAEVTSS